MLFPTISFAIFFTVTFLLYWLTISNTGILGRNWANQLRKIVLLVASYIFYGIWDWRFLPLLILSSTLNYMFAKILLSIYSRQDDVRCLKLPQLQTNPAAQNQALAQNTTWENRKIQRFQTVAKWLLGLAITGNLGVLVFFKYINWLLVNLNTVLNAFGMPLLLSQVTIILPLGVSFFTFQNISFLIDIYRRKLTQSGSYFDYSLYIAFFPQLIAGPIVRANSILPQLQRLPDRNNIYLSDAFSRILIGLVKKVFIANTLSTTFVDPIFLDPASHSSLELLLGAYAYSAVIYCDFSAYSDMAVGLGLLCGIRLMENFDRPYARCSLQSFWRGWHISLSTWLRDYLYIPLGGSRRGSRYLNTLVTMLLGGLWHGASWTFLYWGGLHGIVISIEQFLRQFAAKRSPPEPGRIRAGIKAWFGWLYCFHFVTLTWILFRSPSFAVAGAFFRGLLRFDFSSAGTLSNLILIVIGLGILPQILLPRATTIITKVLDALPIAAQILLFASSIALLQVVLPDSVAPFIYYQF